MFEFSKLCKAVENLDPQTYEAVITEKTARILAALSLLANPKVAIEAYFHLVMAAVAADGKLAEEEYHLLKPVFDAVEGRSVTFEEAKQIFKDAGFDKPGEYKDAVDAMVDIFGTVSLDVKNDMITVCLLVCAVDGKISFSEKRWIKQLCR